MSRLTLAECTLLLCLCILGGLYLAAIARSIPEFEPGTFTRISTER